MIIIANKTKVIIFRACLWGSYNTERNHVSPELFGEDNKSDVYGINIFQNKWAFAVIASSFSAMGAVRSPKWLGFNPNFVPQFYFSWVKLNTYFSNLLPEKHYVQRTAFTMKGRMNQSKQEISRQYMKELYWSSSEPFYFFIVKICSIPRPPGDCYTTQFGVSRYF